MLSSSLCSTISPKNDNNAFFQQDRERPTVGNRRRETFLRRPHQTNTLICISSILQTMWPIKSIVIVAIVRGSSVEDVINYINVSCLRLWVSWKFIATHRCRLFAFSSCYFHWADNRKTPINVLTKMECLSRWRF